MEGAKRIRKPYCVYIVRCADGSLYTGVAADVDRRVYAHNHSVTGARYTKARRPVELLCVKKFRSRSTAQKEESRIKKLSHEDKLRYCNN